MKMSQSFVWLFWAILYCILYLVSGSDEDLMDFDFTDLKEIDWNYENDNRKEFSSKSTTEQNKITFDDDDDLLEENLVYPFDWREKALRTALSKSLTNKAVRQKFVEVMPILRVLSKQQRLVLSALITAQINAKRGNELKLDQVRMMFGDDKSLILPIVYDIANLVSNSAQKYIKFDYNLADFGDFSKTKVSYEKRNLKLTPEELAAEKSDETINTLPVTAQMKQNMKLDSIKNFMSEKVLDPKEINEELEILKLEKVGYNKNVTKNNLDNVKMELENDSYDMTDILDINRELQKNVSILTRPKLNKTQELEALTDVFNTTEKSITVESITTSKPVKRIRRSARESRELVHKLTRYVPTSLNEEDLQRSHVGRTLKLNTTAFASSRESNVHVITPTTTTISLSNSTVTATTLAPIIVNPEGVAIENYESYQLAENMAFAGLNTSEIFLNENDSKDNDLTVEAKTISDDEILPTPEELIGAPQYRILADKRKPINNRRVRVQAGTSIGLTDSCGPASMICKRFTPSLYIQTDDYPIEQIMGSIRRHKSVMTALLAEYNENLPNVLDNMEDFDDYFLAKKRREDSEIQGSLCQTIVRYARPQKARSANGEWKYIVNTGEHTQTLRLEKCSHPDESCSYITSTYRSHCVQVYNYHRLLSWDKVRGLHVDIFKVPTCCSCKIDGYKQSFSALTSSSNKNFTPAQKNKFHYQRQQLDYNEEDVEEDVDYTMFGIQQQHNQYEPSSDANEVHSKTIRAKIPRPTVGSYLSPPESGEYETRYIYKDPSDSDSVVVKRQPSLRSTTASQAVNKSGFQRRRPHKRYSDRRLDQDFSSSELQTEVTDYGTTKRTYQKRKNIYSVTHTAKADNDDISDNGTTTIPASTGTIRAFNTFFRPIQHTQNRRPLLFNTNAYQNSTATATATTIPTTSAVARNTTPTRTRLSSPSKKTASLPIHYYTHPRYVLKTQSRLHIPHTITSTSTEIDSEKATSTTEYERGNTATTLPSEQSDIYAVNPEIDNNNYEIKYNQTFFIDPTITSSSSHNPSSSKRINYSYHPILDFFENNRRATATATVTTSKTSPPQTYKDSSISSSQLYPHKIQKSIPDNGHQIPTKNYETNFQQTKIQKYWPLETQHNIGFGADVAAAAAGDGSSGVVFNNPKQNINTNIYSNTKYHSANSQHSIPFSQIPDVDDYELPVETGPWYPFMQNDYSL